MLSACGTTPPVAATPQPSPLVQPAIVEPSAPAPGQSVLAFDAVARAARIRDAGRWLECVAYARAASGIALRGDAAAWWDAAAGRYARGARPEAGAVLVFRRTNTSAGHVAVVRQVLGPRLVVADHANWLNNGRIHEGTPIEDVSRDGDWSAVRVWYTPGGAWGRSKYATYGFVYPRGPAIAARF